MHTPSTPTVTPPASATDPRYSTSGILNARIKEANRQGLLSTYGGRTGANMDINKFANNKINMRDPSLMPILENIAKTYNKAVQSGKARGVSNNATSSKSTAKHNTATYNAAVDDINKLLEGYGTKTNLTKASGTHNYDKRALHSSNYGASNAGEVNESISNAGKASQIFNDVEASAKGKKQSK